jgi:hypothetical protein
MTGKAHDWTELRVHAAAESHPAILTRAVAPFLNDGSHRGHFVPDPERGTMSVFLQGAAENPESLRAAFTASLREAGLGSQVSGVELVPHGRTSIHEVQMSGPDAQELVDEFLIETSPFVLSLVEAIGGQATARAGVAFDLMVSQPVALKDLLFARLRTLACPLAFISYRSHVDGFFVMSKDPPATKQAFDQRYQRTAEQMKSRLGAVTRQLAGQGPLVSRPAQEWVALIARYAGRIQDGLRAGTLIVNVEEGDGYMGDNFDLAISPFHQAIQDDPQMRALATVDPEFNTMRVMASLLYLTLHRMGLRFIERYLLCYSVTRSFEELYRLEPVQAITQFSDLLYRRPAATMEA